MNSESCDLSRGGLAKQSGVNAETIRYYEKIGLLREPPRSEGGHRIYGNPDLRRLSFIRRSRELGFTLDQIRGLLELVDGGDYTCAEVHQRTAAHLIEVKQRLADLRKMEKVLRRMVAQCDDKLVPECPIIDALFA